MYENFEISNYGVFGDVKINYGLDDEYTKVWSGFSHREGEVFPDELLQKRARLYTINEGLYRDSIQNLSAIYGDMLNLSPLCNLYNSLDIIRNGYYKYITDSWVALILSNGVEIGIKSAHSAEVLDCLNDAGLILTLEEVLRSLFQTGNAVVHSIVRGDCVTFRVIPCKQWIPYVDNDNGRRIKCNEIYNVYEKDGLKYIEFVCFIDNGKVEKYTFIYNDGVIGKFISSESWMAYGGITTSSVSVFTMNRVSNSIYGTDSYRYWETPISNLNRIALRKQKLIRRSDKLFGSIPKTILNNTERSLWGNMVDTTMQDLINVHDNQPGSIYSNEEIKLENYKLDNLDVLQKVEDDEIKRLSIICGLGITYFDTVSASSTKTGEAQKVMMKVTVDTARLISQQLTPTIKEIVKFVCLMFGDKICNSDVNIQYKIFTMTPDDRDSEIEGKGVFGGSVDHEIVNDEVGDKSEGVFEVGDENT